MNNKIENAIKKLKLKENDINTITYGNMQKICKIANIDILQLMQYLRFKR